MAERREQAFESGFWYFPPGQEPEGKPKRRTLKSRNPKMQAAIRTAMRAAKSNATILLLGETGTGKELFARAIHTSSARREGPFVAVNCAGLAETLLESELFGHEKGAFTGADRARRGRFEMAQGGTLFLDEVGEMSLGAQAKLLRVLEHRSFERVGGEEKIRSDARVIAATNRELAERVASCAFRQDLYYRLNEITIRLPPLREHLEDMPMLVNRFIEDMGGENGVVQVQGVSAAAFQALLRYPWPGNIRELRSVIQRGCRLAERDMLWIEDLAIPTVTPTATTREKEDLSMAAVEKRHIEYVLRLAKGKKSLACELLAISRPTLDEKIKRYQIPPPPSAPEA